MLAIYRCLLYLYPSAYRDEYGEEMMAVFYQVEAAMGRKSSVSRTVSEHSRSRRASAWRLARACPKHRRSPRWCDVFIKEARNAFRVQIP